MDAFVSVLKSADDVVWGVPTIILIMATGILLTARLGVIQFRKLGKALKYMVSNEQGGKGEISSFGALCTALAATVGTGNIVGVATAIAAGGPGALFPSSVGTEIMAMTIPNIPQDDRNIALVFNSGSYPRERDITAVIASAIMLKGTTEQ